MAVFVAAVGFECIELGNGISLESGESGDMALGAVHEQTGTDRCTFAALSGSWGGRGACS